LPHRKGERTRNRLEPQTGAQGVGVSLLSNIIFLRNCLSRSHSEQNSKSAKPITVIAIIIGLSRVVLLLAILCLKKWELGIESYIARAKRNPNFLVVTMKKNKKIRNQKRTIIEKK